MNDQPTRPRFQFSLRAAVLMMLAVGGLMWLIAKSRFYGYRPDGTPGYSAGWPLPFNDRGFFPDLNPVQIGIDVLCWLFILFVLAIVVFQFEAILRSREVRRRSKSG